MGVVTAGGIGQELKNSVDLLDFARVFTMILIILGVAGADPNSLWFSLRTKGSVMLVSSLRLFRQIFAICVLSLFVSGIALADPPIAAVNTEHGLAIKGYDPVSYFTTGKATPGLAQFSTAYNGVTYRFASAENRDRFIALPEKFVPQYGGYCAYAISLSTIADIDPEEWSIVNNKLYLNNGFLAQTLWSFDKSGNIVKGDHNWPLVPLVPKLGNR